MIVSKIDYNRYHDVEELAELINNIQWRSADKDNMEFEARITYVQMDAIRAALEGHSY